MDLRNKYMKETKCSSCGKMTIISYHNWKKGDKVIVKKDENLCRECFKERTGTAIF